MADLSSLADARAAAVTLGAGALLPAEPVGLDACPGRIAAEDVAASIALPAFDSSAMDGWAVRAADLAGVTDDGPVVLAAAGESRAGHPAGEVLAAGTAARISTGARLPAGADAVVRVEDVEVSVEGVLVRRAVDPGRDVRRAAEDIAIGDLAVRSGDELRPGHVALLAGLGVDAVLCRRRPRALVVVTGDELRPVAAGEHRPTTDGDHHPPTACDTRTDPAGDVRPASAGDIGTDPVGDVRPAPAGDIRTASPGDPRLSSTDPSDPDPDAIRAAAGRILDVGGPALAALLRALGADVVGVRHAGDTLDETIAALRPEGVDLVVSTGGVSVGPHDHVRGALEQLGATASVEALDLQPGRPTWLGSLKPAAAVDRPASSPEAPAPPANAPARPTVASVPPSVAPAPATVVPVLALPGNPGAAITVATLLLTPLLRGMSGRPAAVPVHARLAEDERGGRRVRALRVALEEDGEGRRVARVLDGQQAHRLASFPSTEAFALVLAGDRPLAAGTRVEVVPMPGTA